MISTTSSNNATVNHSTTTAISPQQSNIVSSFNQLQSSPAFQTSLSNSPSLQALFQLIQNLIKQLGGKPDQAMPETKPEQEPKQEQPGSNPSPHNSHTGTSGDDTLKGGRGDDQIQGLEGNDDIRGRQGDDTLLGGAGNDRLYGGKGDDELQGGSGNDYLSGGRGSNTLFGGDGRDTLASRLGNDVLDGGNGHDTARIRGNIDDYTITKDLDVFTLKNNKTEQTITVKNVEDFRFNDLRLTSGELTQRIGGTGTDSPPGAQGIIQTSEVAQQFLDDNYSVGAELLEVNGDDRISVGDRISYVDNKGRQRTVAIDQALADTLNGLDQNNSNSGELELSDKVQEYLQDNHGFNPHISDLDGNGKITVGDRIESGGQGGIGVQVEIIDQQLADTLNELDQYLRQNEKLVTL